ncbi:hypothetical protein DICPUDRAFT_149721 [Dictyostelium purpureum]|uniref:Fungal lipase-type domain-containing protein n=1 Tax=Dictyostelium purpureum TaxID=5786 RepID=F0ZEH8_DICPU|nr:uncharacterized protein DICPUDRAFT_149721 [Dictyostelium purpureum]EGC37629.1 hypothetical protein DICPUDRAFT_149721 [Dictyostelium purpureum]|eukprot:XP_003285817.1 hypothetical protein DICPUDRAFT_149721 [Dictyostelium purpureum]
MIKRLFFSLCIIFLLNNNNRGVNANSYPDFKYDQNEALQYLIFSYAAYCSGNDIQTWNCTTCQNPQIKDFNIVSSIFNITTNTQAYVGYLSDQVVVSFRGSMDVQSWITNFQFLQTPYEPYPSAKVHQGFYNAWLSVREEVKSAIDISLSRCGSGCGKIMVVGHSLGGALATLCISEVQGWYTIPAYIYNYGSPRVGDVTFASYFNKVQPNTYRVVNQKDIVPHVAPQGLLNYHHVPTEVYFPTNDTQDYRVCNDSGEDPTCSDSVIGLSIYDHLHYFNQHCCCR